MGPDGHPSHSLIVIGAISRGIEALVEGLVADAGRHPGSRLRRGCISGSGHQQPTHILNRAGRLRAQHGSPRSAHRVGQHLHRPLDFHLLLGPGKLLLTRGPRYTARAQRLPPLSHRAHAYGPRAIGVILSGTLDDGAAGLRVHQRRRAGSRWFRTRMMRY